MRLQHFLVLLRLIHAQIGKELSALSHLSKKPAACGVIFLMFMEVIRKQFDLFGQNRNLHLWGTCVLRMSAMLCDERFLRRALDRHRESWEQGKIGLPRLRRDLLQQKRERTSILRIGA